MSEVRINKFIADAGICSRRAADKLIEEGKVTVNGVVVENGVKVTDADEVIVDGKLISREEEKLYFAFNKPVGIVCTAEKREKDNIIDFINYNKRLMYAGRLDKESEGLIILTNDGDLIDKMMRAREKHEKEYIVKVNRDIDEDFIYNMRSGIYLEELEVTTRKCKVSLIDSRTFRITLTQGLNRQIRRMCSALDYKVVSLKRVRVVNIELGDLKVGKMRPLTDEELNELMSLVKA